MGKVRAWSLQPQIAAPSNHLRLTADPRARCILGAIELMRLQTDLMPNALMLLRQAETGLNAADHHLRSLQKVVRVRTKETPVGPALDLARSTAPCN